MAQTYFFEPISETAYGIFKDGQDLGIATVFTKEDAEIIVGALNAASPIGEGVKGSGTPYENDYEETTAFADELVDRYNQHPTLYRENARLTEQVEQYKAEVTRLRSLINEFADGIKNA